MQSRIAPTRAASLALDGPRRPYVRAIVWLLILGPIFFLTYGMAAYWTSTLPDVPSFSFSWERQIPFVEWTIVPYMSIDAFYVASLFLCATRRELDTHGRRLLLATIVSVLCFLIFPLRYDVPRPPTSGLCGALFDVLSSVDLPYNQAPSLHIGLLVLLWLVHRRHLNGLLKYAMHLWFALIGLSVLTTYQHRIVDCIGGIIVAVVCVYVFPARRHWSRIALSTDVARIRLACYYAVGACTVAGLAVLIGAWAWLLLWPAFSLSLVALAYAWLGPAVFQKNSICSTWAAQALLLPYQTGAWLSSRWLTYNAPPHGEVIPGLLIGRAPGRNQFARMHVGAILDLTAEFTRPSQSRQRRYFTVPMLDLVAPTLSQLEEATKALDELYPQGSVLVHCALGYTRSALVIAAWLYQRRVAASREEAIRLVRTARPQIVLSQAALSVLDAYICRIAIPSVTRLNPVC